MSDKILTPTVIALGYFDSVHKGHQKVIKRAKEFALKNNASLTVVSFGGNLRAALSNGDEKLVYTCCERQLLYEELGADNVFFLPTNKTFLNRGKVSFLNYINEKFNVIAYACGEDYRFGKCGKGDVDALVKYANTKNQKVLIEKILSSGDDKISTTLIKKLLTDGNVKEVKSLLGRAYSLSGVVIKDRQVGKNLGFPTLNIIPVSEKHSLKSAVYAGHCMVFGKVHKAIINYGARPTFALNEVVVEAHLLGFDGDLYGKEITLYFDEYLREVEKFDSVNELKLRLEKDLKKVEEMQYD